MFQGLVFLLVYSPAFDIDEVSKVQDIIESRHGIVYVKQHSDTNINHLSQKLINEKPINHIITETIEFIEYRQAQNSMISITTPKWVYESIESGKTVNYKTFNPDPNFFMKDVFICIADNLPSGDKNAIYGGIRAFGGQYLDDLTKYTTHLIACDLTNIKSIIALNAVRTDGTNKDQDPMIKIVLPHWIDDCFKAGKKLDESSYLLSNPIVNSTGKPIETQQTAESCSISTPIMTKETDSPPLIKTSFFEGKKFYLSSDYNLSERIMNCLYSIIELNGGELVKDCDVENIDIYIGQYRFGTNFEKCCKSKRIVIGNLQWFYHILLAQNWVLPTNSNILHYPIPKEPIKEFQGIKISLTNYSGDARFYLTKLIDILGGQFTKTLTRDNNFLIAAKKEGKKFDTAYKKWLNNDDKPIIKIVNHLWLEECYVKWSFLDEKQSRFQYFGKPNSNGIENLLGKIKLDINVLNNWFNEDAKDLGDDKVSSNDTNNNIGDSMSEDESVKLSVQPSAKTSSELQYLVKKSSQNSSETKQKEKPSQLDKDDLKVEESSHSRKILLPSDTIVTLDEHSSPVGPSIYNGRIGRSAKQKAALKLHADMSDLNDYTVMSKSVNKMKSYMKELEEQTASKKKGPILERKIDSEQNIASNTTTTIPKKRSLSEKEALESLNEKKKVAPNKKSGESAFKVIAIMTGCEHELTMSRVDVVKLSRAGIKVVNDSTSTKFPINTIIAPRILRTEKFLKSLSKISKIIHPNYLIEVLKIMESENDIGWTELSKKLNIDDYSLEKVISNKEIDQELGITDKKQNGLKNLVTSLNKGKIFANTKLNLSTSLNGGVNLITDILETHGLNESRSFKSVTASNAKQLLKNENEDVIFIAHKTKDSKSIGVLKKIVPNIVIVEWDWCVKSIFKMNLEDFENYKI